MHSGPADPGVPSTDRVPEIKPWKKFNPVKVLLHSNEESGHEREREFGWFQVKITQVGSFEIDIREQKVVHPGIGGQQIVQAIQLAINSAMVMSNMIALSRSPRIFFFKQSPLSIQPPMHNPSCMPLYGLIQSIRLSSNGSAVLSADLGIGWKATGKDERNEAVPLLQTKDLKALKLDPRKPVPKEKQSDFLGIMAKLRFDVKYTRSESWIVEKLQAPISKQMNEVLRHQSPKEQEESLRDRERIIRRDATIFKQNRRLPKPRDDEEQLIYWSANNPKEFTFPFTSKEGFTEERTVAEHFKKSHDIDLVYPNMPIILISDRRNPICEYIPLEFLFLSSENSPRGREEHDHRMLAHALKVNDEYACARRIDQVTRLLQDSTLVDQLSRNLKLLNLQVDPSPITVKAKVLREPNIVHRKGSLDVNKGSWNLDGAEFLKSACLHSFAVVDLSVSPNSCIEMVSGVINKMAEHGIFVGCGMPESQLPRLVRDLSTAPKQVLDDPLLLKQVFLEAKKKAWNKFAGWSFEKNVCYHTRAVTSDEGSIRSVAVIPPHLVENLPETESPFFGSGSFACVVEPPPGSLLNNMDAWSNVTHEIQLCNDTRWHDAIFFYLLEVNGIFFDFPPYGVRVNGNGQLEAFNESAMRFMPFPGRIRPMFKPVHDLASCYSPGDLKSFKLKGNSIQVIPEHHIDTPNLMFVIIPEKETRLYNLSKFMAHQECGVNSQTMTVAAFDRQRRKGPDQYFSNIALKVNAKLGNLNDRACAWCWSHKFTDHTPDPERQYLDQTATMLVGLSLAKSQGQESKMVVVGAALLDIEGQQCAYEARAQEKSYLINSQTTKSIFKDLIISYIQSKGTAPTRIIIIRDSGHEGKFHGMSDG